MCDGKTFSTTDIKNPTSRLVTQLTCQLEPTQGAHYCPQRFLQSILGGAGGGSTLAILRLTALYNFEPEEEYSKEPKERERDGIRRSHPTTQIASAGLSPGRRWQVVPLILHRPLCVGKIFSAESKTHEAVVLIHRCHLL